MTLLHELFPIRSYAEACCFISESFIWFDIALVDSLQIDTKVTQSRLFEHVKRFICSGIFEISSVKGNLTNAGLIAFV